MDEINRDLDNLLTDAFNGRVVRKDLTKMLKEGANVPVFVLEYLLGMYCASDDDDVINQGMQNVKRILAENYVRPDEAEKIKHKIKELGEYKIIDKVSVKLNTKNDTYEADIFNLGIGGIAISGKYVKDYQKLLSGGIWCMITLSYFFDENSKTSPFRVEDLKPVQMPNLDLDEIKEGRKAFNKDQWMDCLMRSIGIEGSTIESRTKLHLLNRMIPLVENNYNSIELGPRSTGKSHLYKEISPYSVLVSGGQTSVANLFYNMGRRTIGLVGMWDCIAFDEVANVGSVNESMDLMKDYMASGSFVRGTDSIQASASMVFVGNVNDSIDSLVKTSHLFAPLPEKMIDSAFLDRFHAYIPGWEIPKFGPENFTNNYGFIVDYLAGFCREMRKQTFADVIDVYFKLGKDLKQRDVIAVRKTVSGLIKLLYPDGVFGKEEVRECLEYALETRRRVKEQLKKIGGLEFYDVHFSYIDQETLDEYFVAVPEQGGNKLIPEGQLPPGNLHVINKAINGKLGLYRFETQVVAGSGKLNLTGFGSTSAIKEGLKIAFDYFKANASGISSSMKVNQSDYSLHLVDFNGNGPSPKFTLAGVVCLCSSLLKKPIQEQMVILGNMTLGGTIEPVESLSESLQIAFDAGARKVLLPTSSAMDISSVPADLFSKFQVNFYSDPKDAVLKALGV